MLVASGWYTHIHLYYNHLGGVLEQGRDITGGLKMVLSNKTNNEGDIKEYPPSPLYCNELLYISPLLMT